MSIYGTGGEIDFFLQQSELIIGKNTELIKSLSCIIWLYNKLQVVMAFLVAVKNFKSRLNGDKQQWYLL